MGADVDSGCALAAWEMCSCNVEVCSTQRRFPHLFTIYPRFLAVLSGSKARIRGSLRQTATARISLPFYDLPHVLGCAVRQQGQDLVALVVRSDEPRQDI